MNLTKVQIKEKIYDYDLPKKGELIDIKLGSIHTMCDICNSAMNYCSGHTCRMFIGCLNGHIGCLNGYIGHLKCEDEKCLIQ